MRDNFSVGCSYDLRFPEVYQQLSFVQGAQVLLAPSAFTKITGMILSEGHGRSGTYMQQHIGIQV